MLDATKERSCDPKRSYVTRAAARRAAKKQTRSVHLKTYLCKHCQMFHNGRPEGYLSSKRGRAELQKRFANMLSNQEVTSNSEK